jgi:hypothetical protein
MSLHPIFSKFVLKLVVDGVDPKRLASAFPFGTGESSQRRSSVSHLGQRILKPELEGMKDKIR